MSRSTVVIGGGLAGIAASLDLARAGVPTTLIEARNVLGGRVRSHGTSPERDNAQHIFLGACSNLRDFLRELGMEDTFLQRRAHIQVANGQGKTAMLGERGPFGPLSPLVGLARYDLLTIRERLGIIRALVPLRRAQSADGADDLPFSKWLSDHGQSSRQRRYFWDLVVTPTLNAPPERVSTAAAAFVLCTALLSERDAIRVGWATTGLTSWVDGPANRTLAALGVQLRLGTRIRSIATAAGGFRLSTENGSFESENVILAVPHGRVGGLLPPSIREIEPFLSLDKLPAAAIVGVHLRYDREIGAPAMLAAPDSEAEWIFGTSRIRNLSLADGEELTCVLSDADRWLDLRNEDIADRMKTAVEAILPGARSAQLLDAVVYREPRATFVPVPGSARLRPGQVTPVEGLVLAGAYTDTEGWPSTMEGAVRSGITAAAAVIQRH